MRFEEDFQKPLVGDDGGIELNLDALGVAGRAAGDVRVGWFVDMTAGVAANAAENPRHILKHRLGAPKATRGEGRGFSFAGSAGLLRGGICRAHKEKGGQGDHYEDVDVFFVKRNGVWRLGMIASSEPDSDPAADQYKARWPNAPEVLLYL